MGKAQRVRVRINILGDLIRETTKHLDTNPRLGMRLNGHSKGRADLGK